MLDTDAVARSLTDPEFTEAQADAITNAVRLAAEHGDHVTSDQFKVGLAEARTEIAALDTRLSTQIAGLDARLSSQIANLETRLFAVDDRDRHRNRNADLRHPALPRIAERPPLGPERTSRPGHDLRSPDGEHR